MILHGCIHRTDQLIVLIHAHQQVDLRNFLHQRLFIPLSQTARDHQQLAVAGLLILRHFENGVDGLLLGGPNKPAGVHHQHGPPPPDPR